MMITSMVTTATTVMAGMVASSCVLLLSGEVALELASVVSDMAVPTSLWGSVVGCVLLLTGQVTLGLALVVSDMAVPSSL